MNKEKVSPVEIAEGFMKRGDKNNAIVYLNKAYENWDITFFYIKKANPLFNSLREDPRFKELTREEFDKIKIEISVLSTFEPIKSYNEIELGNHGLLLEEAGRAILLPQVATENNYTREQYLTALCHKAGIYGEYWKERMLDINVFTATVFSEK